MIRNEEQAKYAEWLASLKVGDQVAVPNGGYQRGATLHKIIRGTETQFILDRHYSNRFRRKDGYVIGDGYTKIEEVTPEILESIRVSKLQHWFSTLSSNHDRSRIPTKALAAMKAAYDTEMAKATAPQEATP